jgi:hypothetical protein
MDCQRGITCKECGMEAVLVEVRAVEKFERTRAGKVRRYAGLYATIDCIRCGRTQQCVASAPRNRSAKVICVSVDLAKGDLLNGSITFSDSIFWIAKRLKRRRQRSRRSMTFTSHEKFKSKKGRMLWKTIEPKLSRNPYARWAVARLNPGRRSRTQVEFDR